MLALAWHSKHGRLTWFSGQRNLRAPFYSGDRRTTTTHAQALESRSHCNHCSSMSVGAATRSTIGFHKSLVPCFPRSISCRLNTSARAMRMPLAGNNTQNSVTHKQAAPKLPNAGIANSTQHTTQKPSTLQRPQDVGLTSAPSHWIARRHCPRSGWTNLLLLWAVGGRPVIPTSAPGCCRQRRRDPGVRHVHRTAAGFSGPPGVVGHKWAFSRNGALPQSAKWACRWNTAVGQRSVPESLPSVAAWLQAWRRCCSSPRCRGNGSSLTGSASIA